MEKYERLLVLGVLWCICTPLGKLLWWQVRRGKLIITDWERIVEEVREGKLVLLFNHPTLFETALVQALLYREAQLNLQKYFVHSTPADDLYPRWAQWFYTASRGIPINRSVGMSVNSAKQLVEVFTKKESVSIHGEGGRTNSKNLDTEIIIVGDRKMREFSQKIVSVLRLTFRKKGRILPIWFEISCWNKKNNFFNVVWHWLSTDMVITIHVGEILLPTKQYSLQEAEQAVITA